MGRDIIKDDFSLFRDFFDSACAIPVAVVNSGGVIEYFNRKGEETFGYLHSEVPDLDHWWRLAYPEDKYREETKKSWLALVDKARQGSGEIEGGEYQVTCKDGSVKICRFFGSVVRDKVFIMLEDITGRSKAERALRESEATLWSILDNSPVPMAIQTVQGKIEYFNAKYTQTYGYSLADTPDRETWTVKAAPDEKYRAELVAMFNEAFAAAAASGGQLKPLGFLFACKNGEVRNVSISGMLLGEKIFAIFEDITERFRAMEALRGSEALLRKIIEQAPIAMAIVALDGTIEYINRKAELVFGYPPADIPNMDRWWVQAYPDEAYRKEVIGRYMGHVYEALEKGGEIAGEEYLVTCKDGSKKTCYIFGVIAGGKVFVMFDDITARVETERALRERESLYRSLIETTGTGYVVLDGGGRVLDANREYVRLSGHADLKEIMGRSVLEWSAPHSQARVREAVEIVVRDGRVSNFEVEYIDKAGRFTTIEINATAISRAGVQQILGLCRDVSARSKTEAHLRDSEALYRALVETTRTGYVVVDNTGKVLDANREYVRLAGHADLKQIIGRSVAEWTAPDKRDENAAAVAQCARDGYIFNFETDYLHAGGKRVPIEINATVVSRGGVPQIHTLCRDISQRRKDAAELKNLNQDLENRVNARTGELMAANVELSHEIAQRMEVEREREKLQQELLQSQKMEVVGRLSAGIAHDFNNILVAISGYAEFLMNTLPEGAQAREDLGEIVRETERGAMLTRQLMAIGRKQPVELKVLSVNAVAGDSARMLKRLVGSNMNLETRLDPEAGQIKADAGQVSQVLMNLVVNARDAMPEGGKLVISTGNEEVTEGQPPMCLQPGPGRYVTISVSDTGTGMSPETVSHIFEPFFTTKAEGKGTGLGLSTVYGIVHQSGGGIDVKTAPAQGTTFKIYFKKEAATF